MSYHKKKEQPEQEEPDMILIGWKSICEVCGGITLKTMRKAAKEYPISDLRNFNGRPSISRSDLLDWFKNSFPKRRKKIP